MLKQNDNAFYKERECTVMEVNYLGVRIQFDDDESVIFVKALEASQHISKENLSPVKHIDTKLDDTGERVNRSRDIVRLQKKLSGKYGREQGVRWLAHASETKHQQAKLKAQGITMNVQLTQQVLGNINAAPLSDIKAWKEFLTQCGEALTKRIETVIDLQKKQLAEVEEMLGAAPKTKRKIIGGNGGIHLTRDNVIKAMHNLTEGIESGATCAQVHLFLVNEGKVEPDRQHRTYYHLTKLVQGETLISAKQDPNDTFSPVVYRFAQEKRDRV